MVKQAHIDVSSDILSSALILFGLSGLRVVGSAASGSDVVRLVVEGDAIPDDCDHIKAEFSRERNATTISFLPATA